MTRSVHVANASDQNIWVLAVAEEDRGTGPGDVIFYKARGAAHESSKLPENIKDLLTVVTTGRRSTNTGNGPDAQAIQVAIDAIKKHAICIVPRDFKNVKQQDTGVRFKGDKVTLLVISDDCKQVAMWESDPDHSWIATRGERIVRSRHGTIWEEDPAAGSPDWSIPKA